MKKTAIFTICAKNYLGLALTLEKSLSCSSNFDFFVLVADEFENDSQLPNNVLLSRTFLNMDDNLWISNSFKYDITEFCTSIKPLSFIRIFELGYENAIYLDPDIYFFNDPKIIIDNFSSYKVLLTPHSTDHNFINKELNYTGIFNCGFVALSNDNQGLNFLNWWHNSLMQNGYISPEEFYFTDQKWMDHIFSFVDISKIYIARNLGWNVAPWDFEERSIFSKVNKLFIKYRNNISKKNYYIVNKDDSYIHSHLVQSHYAYDYLSKNKIQNKKISYLSDYINDSFFENDQNNLQKENIVLYNPQKGEKFTQKIISANKNTNFSFVPIQNMSRIKVKVHIDFGNHPKMDRIPREATMCDCCIITGKNGSAKFNEDLPIPDKYKFDEKKNKIPSILAAITLFISNYELEKKKFESYKNFIMKQKNNFKIEVKNIFEA